MKGLNFFCMLCCLLMGQAEMYSQKCQLYSLPTEQGLTAVYFADEQNGWLVGVNGTVFKTSNAGADWQAQHSGTVLQLNDVYFKNANEGFIVGNEGLILQTIDAGEHWAVVATPTVDCLFAIDNFEEQLLWVVGSNGAVLQSEDSGSTWKSLTAKEANGNLYDLAATSEGDVIAVGEGNQLINLSTSRSNLILQNSEANGVINTSVAISDDNLYISSSEGLSKRNLGSKGERNQESLQSGFIRKLAISADGKGLLVGFSGQVKAMDQAGHWTSLDCSTQAGLNDVSFSTAQRAWAVGNQGTLLKIDFERSENPQSFLSSISPNPSSGTFVLSTTAKDYTAKVYDDVGRLVLALPASELASQSFDLRGETSGLYLVKVESEGYSEMLKVVLINE